VDCSRIPESLSSGTLVHVRVIQGEFDKYEPRSLAARNKQMSSRGYMTRYEVRYTHLSCNEVSNTLGSISCDTLDMPASPKSTKSAISKAALGVAMIVVHDLAGRTRSYWSVSMTSGG
jgi:hypothetical protein